MGALRIATLMLVGLACTQPRTLPHAPVGPGDEDGGQTQGRGGAAGSVATTGAAGSVATTGAAGSAATTGAGGRGGGAGSGAAAGAAAITGAAFAISPAGANLIAAVNVTQVGTQMVTLTVMNVGTQAATPTVTSSDTSNFDLANGCMTSVAAGATCSLMLRLTPQMRGFLSTNVSVTPAAIGRSVATVTGTGRELVSLAVTVAGTGTGSVTGPTGYEGNGVNCPTDCLEQYWRATTDLNIRLIATYDEATTVVSWSAPCEGSTDGCVVTLGAAASVTVTFTPRSAVVSHTLTVTRSAQVTGATGIVGGSGLYCGDTCSVTVADGSTVVLTATPTAGYAINTWSVTGCADGRPTCRLPPITADTIVDVKFTKPNVIFATSTIYTVANLQAKGNGDGPAGADMYCRERAAAGAAPNLAGRIWSSIIITGAGSGASNGWARVNTKRGWVRTDGKPFGANPEKFFLGPTVYYPPALDENGERIMNGRTISAALGQGCDNWASSASTASRAGGVPTAGGGGWDNAAPALCDAAFRLYCMSTDYLATVIAPGYAAGAPRLAFATVGLFTPAGSAGLPTADALCASEAAAGSLPGTFRALLATSTASAASRFAGGGPWIRVDGVSVGTLAQLSLASPQLDAPINVTSGGVYSGLRTSWTGAVSPSAVGTEESTCTPSGGASWTSPEATTTRGGIGRAVHSDSAFFATGFTTCSAALPVYCLQM